MQRPLMSGCRQSRQPFASAAVATSAIQAACSRYSQIGRRACRRPITICSSHTGLLGQIVPSGGFLLLLLTLHFLPPNESAGGSSSFARSREFVDTLTLGSACQYFCSAPGAQIAWERPSLCLMSALEGDAPAGEEGQEVHSSCFLPRRDKPARGCGLAAARTRGLCVVCKPRTGIMN